MSDMIKSAMTVDELTLLFGGSVPGDALKLFMGPGTDEQKRSSLELLAAAHNDPRIPMGVIIAKEMFVALSSGNTKTFEELIPDETQRRDHMVFWLQLFRRICAMPEFGNTKAQQGEVK